MADRDSPAVPSRRFPGHLAVEATLRDTDLAGHVNNGVYLNWFEEVRTRYVVSRLSDPGAGEVSFILASSTLNFRSPVRLLEVVDLYCGPARVGKKSWELAYELRARSDGRLVCDGRSVQVQYDYESGKTVPLSEDWRLVLEEDLLR
jgi:acyl-CoA thioester hydrolase